MIYFVTHIFTDAEAIGYNKLTASLAKFHPDAKLITYNQTGKSGYAKDEIMAENIKFHGFIWTQRFCEHFTKIAQPTDLLIKVDPDTQIKGTVAIPPIPADVPTMFGAKVRYFKGGVWREVVQGSFQGFNYPAAKAMLGARVREDRMQDNMVIQVAGDFNFVPVPFIDVVGNSYRYNVHATVIH